MSTPHHPQEDGLGFDPESMTVESAIQHAKGSPAGDTMTVLCIKLLAVECERLTAALACEKAIHESDMEHIVMIRCTEHARVPKVNGLAWGDAECGACIAMERDCALRSHAETLKKLVQATGILSKLIPYLRHDDGCVYSHSDDPCDCRCGLRAIIMEAGAAVNAAKEKGTK